jgi:hypothetical protein
MPPPIIRACIVCEQARPEASNKWALLGFFGVTPNVRIKIANFAIPVTLCFVFTSDEFVGKVHVEVRVVAPSGASIPGALPADGEFFPNQPGAMFYMHYQAVLPGPGRYTVVLVVNGADIYRDAFELLPAT